MDGHRRVPAPDGLILEEGPPAQVLSATREDRTRRFLARFIDAGRL